MDFVTTTEFDSEYQELPRSEWQAVDESLERVLDDPTSTFARRGRLTDGTWICVFTTRVYSYRLY